MASVKRRDRQEIHHSEHDRQQRKDVKETIPVPCRREYLSYGYEAAHRLICLCARCEYKSQVLDISAYGLICLDTSSGDGAEECVFLYLDIRSFQHNADGSCRVDLNIHPDGVSASEEAYFCGLAGKFSKQRPCVLEKFHIDAPYADDLVASPQV